jgi:acetyltransferase-like isoleucine patch superfamily enzyme
MPFHGEVEPEAFSAATLCAGRSIQVGAETIIGAGALILDNDFHQLSAEGVWLGDSVTGARPVRIGRSVFVGAQFTFWGTHSPLRTGCRI